MTDNTYLDILGKFPFRIWNMLRYFQQDVASPNYSSTLRDAVNKIYFWELYREGRPDHLTADVTKFYYLSAVVFGITIRQNGTYGCTGQVAQLDDIK
jgi:hypothetical protein